MDRLDAERNRAHAGELSSFSKSLCVQSYAFHKRNDLILTARGFQGQANHFYRYAPTKIEYAINRYQTETKRLYEVLNERLKSQRSDGKGLWLVGGKYSIADLASFSWVNWAEWAGVSLDNFPEVNEWLGVIQQREATQKGVSIPEKFEMKEAMKTKEGENEYEKHHSNWVMKGQEADQEKHK